MPQLTRNPRVRVGAVVAALSLALTAGAGVSTANASQSVVGTSACGKKYAAGYWWTFPTTNIKLRSGPGTNYAALGVVHEGDGLEVKCKAKKAGWMRVVGLNGPQEGRTGWVASKYLH
ncbi:SH3 domain-containing protein [Streptomyces sp. NPDC048392]|uniref:SH3 domain-containing protein n=1 Tax=Streptomyces sp. NPDC048392 TaxID=3365543 RepID=UPI00371CE864